MVTAVKKKEIMKCKCFWVSDWVRCLSHIHSFILNEGDKCYSRRCGQVTEGIEVVTLEIVVYKASSSSSTH